MDEDGRDAKKSEVARNREGRMAVYLHRSRLQPVPIAKPDGRSIREVSIRIGRVDRTTQSTPSQISDNSQCHNEKLEKPNYSTSC